MSDRAQKGLNGDDLTVVCGFCLGDMKVVERCDQREIIIDGEEFDPVPYGEEYDDVEGHCHDCGVEVGNPHHPGCDFERCPNCGGQYTFCDCHTVEKDRVWT